LKSTVESFSINGSVEEGLLQFEFPPGTWVHLKDGTQAIVLTNGRRSVIPKSHRHLPYETLLENAEKDEAGK